MMLHEDELKRIIDEFEARTLPRLEWTHEAHLMVSLWYCMNNHSQAVLQKLRSNIRGYNDVVGTPNTDSEGYHETMTRFWVWQTYRFLSKCRSDDFAANCTAFTASEWGSRNAPFQYYSPELLLSSTARKELVQPDLQPMKPFVKTYMIVEHFLPGKVQEIYQRFEQKGRMLPQGVFYIDSWIDKNVEICYQVMESPSREKIEEWIGKWDDLTRFEVREMISSREAKDRVLSRSS